MDARSSNGFARAGSVMFVLWGILHVWVGAAGVQQFLANPPLGVFAAYGATIEPADGGRTLELGAHMALEFSVILAGYGVLAIWAALLTWRGHALGFWLNVVMLGIVDAAFVIALLVPGFIPFWMGVWGPVLYVLGVGLTAVGLGSERRAAVAAGMA